MDEGLWECWELDGHGNVRQKAPIMRIVLSSEYNRASEQANVIAIDVPEEPYLEYDGRRLSPQSRLTVKENTLISVNCVMRGVSTSVRAVHWYIGDANITHNSKLLMEYSAEEDVSLTISLLTLNVTSSFNSKMLGCQIEHHSWSNTATLTALLNVLCK